MSSLSSDEGQLCTGQGAIPSALSDVSLTNHRLYPGIQWGGAGEKEQVCDQ